VGEERTYSGGVNAFRAFYVDWLAPWAAYRLESIEQTIDRGDRVVVVVRDFGRPKTATHEVGGRNAAVFTFRDGQAIRQEAYPDPTEALKAAGLEPRPLSPNLDFVRSIFADWERGDYSATDWADPELEYTFADGPHPGTWIGHMPEGFRDWTSAWEGYRTEAEEYRELDVERVLVLNRSSGRGKRSGLELTKLQARGAMVLHIRDGKVTRMLVYFDRDRAFVDLGLEA
jgi:ketosteroid isomerase-like protein